MLVTKLSEGQTLISLLGEASEVTMLTQSCGTVTLLYFVPTLGSSHIFANPLNVLNPWLDMPPLQETRRS